MTAPWPALLVVSSSKTIAAVAASGEVGSSPLTPPTTKEFRDRSRFAIAAAGRNGVVDVHQHVSSPLESSTHSTRSGGSRSSAAGETESVAGRTSVAETDMEALWGATRLKNSPHPPFGSPQNWQLRRKTAIGAGIGVTVPVSQQLKRNTITTLNAPPPSRSGAQRRLSHVEAKAAYRDRLSKLAVQTQQAAARTIWKWYNRAKALRIERAENKRRREAAITANLRDYRRQRALERFRVAVKRYMRRINNPEMARRWVRIQARFRGCLARRLFCAMRTRQLVAQREAMISFTRSRAATIIQSAYRRFHVRWRTPCDAVSFLLSRRLHAVYLLQRVVRLRVFGRSAARRLAICIREREHRAAVLVQRRWRRHRVLFQQRLAEAHRRLQMWRQATPPSRQLLHNT